MRQPRRSGAAKTSYPRLGVALGLLSFGAARADATLPVRGAKDAPKDAGGTVAPPRKPPVPALGGVIRRAELSVETPKRPGPPAEPARHTLLLLHPHAPGDPCDTDGEVA